MTQHCVSLSPAVYSFFPVQLPLVRPFSGHWPEGVWFPRCLLVLDLVSAPGFWFPEAVEPLLVFCPDRNLNRRWNSPRLLELYSKYRKQLHSSYNWMFHRNYTDLVTAERVKVQVSPGKRGQMGIPGRNRIFLIGIWRWLKTSQLFYVFSQDQLTFISCIRIFMLIK